MPFSKEDLELELLSFFTNKNPPTYRIPIQQTMPILSDEAKAMITEVRVCSSVPLFSVRLNSKTKSTANNAPTLYRLSMKPMPMEVDTSTLERLRLCLTRLPPKKVWRHHPKRRFKLVSIFSILYKHSQRQ